MAYTPGLSEVRENFYKVFIQDSVVVGCSVTKYTVTTLEAFEDELTNNWQEIGRTDVQPKIVNETGNEKELGSGDFLLVSEKVSYEIKDLQVTKDNYDYLMTKHKTRMNICLYPCGQDNPVIYFVWGLYFRSQLTVNGNDLNSVLLRGVDPVADAGTILQVDQLFVVHQKPFQLENLVFWLDSVLSPMVEGASAGTIAEGKDISGYMNHAVQSTALNQPALTAGRFGFYPSIDVRTGNKFLEIPYAAELALTGDFTFIVILKITYDSSVPGTQRIILERTHAPSSTGHQFELNASNGVVNNNSNEVIVVEADDDDFEAALSASAISDVPVMVIATNDNSGTTLTIRQKHETHDTNSTDTTDGTALFASTEDITIGSGDFDGEFAAICIFNDLLDSDEIDEIYDYFAERFIK